MNPNLAIFLRRFAIVVAGAAILILAWISMDRYTSINWDSIMEWIGEGFVALMMIGMTALILGFLLRQVWTGIMRRSENIYLFCPDESGNGFHIVSKHYFAGGESSDGYDAFMHYFLAADGKLFLSKKINNEKEIGESLRDLSGKANVSLKPVMNKSLSVGYYKANEKLVQEEFRTRNCTIQIKSFENWFDYGFKLTCYTPNGVKKWTRTI